MTRIRLTLVAVALALGSLVAVLAWRALEGLSLERAVRHQAVAERAFDEMERALSSWLEREESRPFEHYRFYASAERRSPLAELADEDFVVGGFQIDPDGSVHTPMQPRDPSAAAARGHWPPSPAVERAIARVTQVVRETWKGEPSGRDSASGGKARVDPQPAERQDPGTTRPLGGPLAAKEKRAKQDLDDAKDESESAYELLGRLNTGADARAERKQKISAARVQRPAPAPSLPKPAFAMEPARPAMPPRMSGAVKARIAQQPAAEGESAPEEAVVDEVQTLQLPALGYVVSESVPSQPDLALAPDAEQQRNLLEEDAVRVALDPMVGRDAGDGHLLLYRTVLVGELGYRQGLVLDRARLGRWLAARALEPSRLSRVATVRFDGDGAAGGEAGFGFQHRFAEPFDALTARLSLAALPGVGSPGAIYGLVGLLALVGAAGLIAIHRTVGVTVHFAERRSNFVSAVTHELKTPLTAIRMYGEMLRDGLVPNEAKREEYYGTITDESERLSRLIDNVLEFSRLERGAREMNWSVGPVGPVMREAAEKLRAHAAHEGFRLDVEIEPGLPPVRYDRDALLQVLFNLVDNAMKYGGSAATRRVVLEARRQAGGVEVAVRDFGPGVSGRHVSRIFEPFYRGEDEMVRSAKGTGIGLALVRDLAERMDAAVRGANAEGGGFRVCLAFRVEPT